MFSFQGICPLTEALSKGSAFIIFGDGMNIKLLALDLDGTTLKSNNTLSPVVKKAIERAAEYGITVVAASGRPYGSMPEYILNMDAFKYFITSNGAGIYDNQGNRIKSVHLKDKFVLSILDLTKDYDLIWEAFLEGETCTDKRYYDNPQKYGCSAAYVDYVRNSRGCTDDMRGYIYENRNRLDSIEFVSTNGELRKTIWSRIEKSVQGVYVTSSSAHFVEIMDSKATKANALRFVCDMLNVSLENTAAAGNADNDVDMIVEAGLGVAVKNACDNCKNNADLIVSSNDDDGIAELINIILK